MQGAESLETPQTAFGPVQWILARSLCRFGRFDLSRLPKAKRQQALQLELDQWSPHAESDYYIGWHNDHALVWGWDRDKANRAIEAQGLKPKRVRILPETLLQPALDQGIRLLQCHEGFEGQIWDAGRLQHSRWWPQLPGTDDWLAFQRNASVQPEAQLYTVPNPQIVALTERSWLTASSVSGDHTERQIEQLALAGALILLTLPTLWYGFAIYNLEQASSTRRDELTQLKLRAEPIQQARREALDALDKINTLRALSPYPNQLQLMSKIAGALPKNDSHIKEWSFQQGLLKITIAASSDLSSSSLVGALQAAGPFREVSALPGPDAKTAILQMQVNPG